jgi:hypothetical protein
MVLRIAPEMFTDPAFDCYTINEIHDEIFKKQEFKTKYPWRNDFSKKIKIKGPVEIDKAIKATVNSLCEEKLNPTGHPYTLSPVDKIIACRVIQEECDLATGDTCLSLFLHEEFELTVISALELVNIWLEKKLITWSEQINEIMKQWDELHERSQPRSAIKRFEQLTKKTYTGS